MAQHFDLAIIGTGSGNSLVTPDFDDKQVAIIEGGTFGGTCLNVGCIPTKMFVYAADVAARRHARAARFGVDATLDGVRWKDIRDRIFGRIDPISRGGQDYRAHGAEHHRCSSATPGSPARAPLEVSHRRAPTHRRPGRHRRRRPRP